ncbi:MAG: hypothetical protein NTV62_00750 [Candidatus Gribaldobacteria bacterium]|nr:hypothetical protein [Candidatus Gribaldobacteria bacterium]
MKIEGRGAFDLFTNAAGFLFSSRLYMWQRKTGLAQIRLAKPKKERKPKEAALKFAPKSRLGLLGSKIDISSIIDREDFFEDLAIPNQEIEAEEELPTVKRFSK